MPNYFKVTLAVILFIIINTTHSILAGQAVDKPKDRQSEISAIDNFEQTPLNFGKTPKEKNTNTTQGVIPSIFSILFYIIIFCSLFVLVIWSIKKYLPGHQQLFSHPAMEILGRTHVDHKKYFTMLRVGKRIFVVGVTPDRLVSLAEINDGEEVTELLEIAKPKTEQGLNIFQKLFKKHVVEVNELKSNAEQEHQIHQLTSHLSSLKNKVKNDGLLNNLNRVPTDEI